jgi:hypothetical protein
MATMDLRKAVVFSEYLDEKGNYIKSKADKEETYDFDLRFIGQHFTPCIECQKRLKRILQNTDRLSLGNKESEPAIGFKMTFEINDASWQTIEKRKATPEEKKKLGY